MARLLMDERRGRAVARSFGLPLFGVLGVLIQAHRLGHITGLAPLLRQMQDNGYRIAVPQYLRKTSHF